MDNDIEHQLPEEIRYKGKLYEFGNEPFDEYLAKHFPEVKLDVTMRPFQRGYIGKWAIKRGKLYLMKLDAMSIDGEDIWMDYFFGSDEPVFADWYSGTIRLMDGRTIHWNEDGKGKNISYDREFYLKIKEGIVQDGGKEYALEDLMIRLQYKQPERED